MKSLNCNRRPADYESTALPAELHQHIQWLTKIRCATSQTDVVRRSQPQEIIPHILPSVNTHFSWSCGPVSIYFLNNTSSIFASISANYRSLFFPPLCIFPAIEKNNADFSGVFSIKTENYFPYNSNSPNLRRFHSFYIKQIIIFFYKELFTFSTQFSTPILSFYFNGFLYNIQLFTSSVIDFSLRTALPLIIYIRSNIAVWYPFFTVYSSFRSFCSKNVPAFRPKRKFPCPSCKPYIHSCRKKRIYAKKAGLCGPPFPAFPYTICQSAMSLVA